MILQSDYLDYVQRALANRFLGPDRPDLGIAGIGVTGDRDRERIAALVTSPVPEKTFAEELDRAGFGSIEFEMRVSGDIEELSAASVPGLAQGGDSIRVAGGPNGTLGCLVRDNRFHQEMLLSCNHVIARCNAANTGDDVFSPANAPSRIGTLQDFETIQFAPGTANIMDAAICRLDQPGTAAAGLRTAGSLSGILANPALGTDVAKEGAVTSVTQGRLAIRNLSILVRIGGRIARFDKQYAVESSAPNPLAAPGDSGSIICDLNKTPLGLLFAAASARPEVYVNPIEPVLIRFGVTIL
jgi:hypothetical protein